MLTQSPLRREFEARRRESAFIAALAGIGIGIIATDTWVAPSAGLVGGPVLGAAVYAVVYAYETLMWRRRHD